MRIAKRARLVAVFTIAVFIGSTGFLARDVYGKSDETFSAEGLTCRVVAGVSLDFPVEFSVDPKMPAVPSLIDSAEAFSGTSDSVRLKVSRYFYVDGVSVDAAASTEASVSFWRQLADSGSVKANFESVTISGLSGQHAEASLSIQGQQYRGHVVAIPSGRTLYQLITVFSDTPSRRDVVERALRSVKIPGNCGPASVS